MIEELRARYARIPQELKDLPNWCIAGPDKSPFYVSTNEVARANVQKPETWKTFDEILVDMMITNAPAIGFVLSAGAGYTCIDLDVKDASDYPGQPDKWTTPSQIERHKRICDAFNTYSELSNSGRGAHLWLKGFIGAGAKRDFVEVYSQERFIVCTGNAFLNEPIKENQELLEILVTEVRGPNYSGPGALVEVEPTEDDHIVWDRAANAGNADKFNALVRGEWSGSYNSQSEADLALMSIFTFYSKSNEQCRRLFRATALGAREKANKNDKYLNYTLEVIRGRQAREQIIDAKGAELARNFVQSLQKSTFADVAAASIATNEQAPPEDVKGTIDWPPGMAGALASYIYHSAPRPAKEISIGAALAFIAGVTGRAFNVSNSGLNMYIIIVARSGVGKEALHSGISLVCEKLRDISPQAQSFVDFSEFASGQALKKACQANPSFVNVSGEWGRRLKRLAGDDRGGDGPMATLRTEMTNLYQKSGRGNLVGGITYSNKEQNVGTMSGIAYSMIGESTPSTFYESLTASMMEDGFLSRFMVIEYEGQRPALNEHRVLDMSPSLAQALSGLCSQALANNMKSICQEVTLDEEAAALLKAFDKQCDEKINANQDESIRQMWNRAHLKALRVAAALAVCDNWHAPVVNRTHAEWALNLIRNDIRIMNSRIASGDVGVGDDSNRIKKLVQLIRTYTGSKSVGASYQTPDEMVMDGIVSYRYLQSRTSQLSQFRTAKQGIRKALDEAIRTLIDNGNLQEMSKDALVDKYAFIGRAFRVLSLPSERTD